LSSTQTPSILGLRGGCSDIATPSWSVDGEAQAYATSGFRAIGIFLHKLERGRMDGFWIPSERIPDENVAAAAAAVRAAGLVVSHVAVAGFFTEPDAPGRIEHTLHAIDVAHGLDAKCLIIAPGRRNGRSYRQTRDHAAAALTEILERTPHGELKLALEPIVTWQSDYLNTLGEALELCDVVDHPNLGVFPDTFHLWETDGFLDDLDRAGPRIFGFHISDRYRGNDHVRVLPGDGDVDFRQVIQTVEATGYTGTYDCEHMVEHQDGPAPDPVDVLSACAGALTRVLQNALA
jgi:sugar phosphate isomerase/epimerase